MLDDHRSKPSGPDHSCSVKDKSKGSEIFFLGYLMESGMTADLLLIVEIAGSAISELG